MSTFDIEHYSSGNENIHTKLFETSHPAGKQITTVNIFQLSLSTKMRMSVDFFINCNSNGRSDCFIHKIKKTPPPYLSKPNLLIFKLANS